MILIIMKTNQNEYDASKYVIGRLASELSMKLQGKDKPSYMPNAFPTIKVYVYNTDKIKFTGAKFTQKHYIKHTGYPGHLKIRSLGEQLKLDSREVIKSAVYNMLPKNKLRYPMMKNLILIKGEKE
jgi:large subunit ribosomal protein L13